MHVCNQAEDSDKGATTFQRLVEIVERSGNHYQATDVMMKIKYESGVDRAADMQNVAVN